MEVLQMEYMNLNFINKSNSNHLKKYIVSAALLISIFLTGCNSEGASVTSGKKQSTDIDNESEIKFEPYSKDNTSIYDSIPHNSFQISYDNTNYKFEITIAKDWGVNGDGPESFFLRITNFNHDIDKGIYFYEHDIIPSELEKNAEEVTYGENRFLMYGNTEQGHWKYLKLNSDKYSLYIKSTFDDSAEINFDEIDSMIASIAIREK